MAQQLNERFWSKALVRLNMVSRLGQKIANCHEGQ